MLDEHEAQVRQHQSPLPEAPLRERFESAVKEFEKTSHQRIAGRTSRLGMSFLAAVSFLFCGKSRSGGVPRPVYHL